MKHIGSVLRFLLLNRIARNILFWTLLGLASAINTSFFIKDDTLWHYFFFFVVAFVAYGPILYLNNLLLLPKLLLNKKYGLYFGVLFASIIVSSHYTRYVEGLVMRLIPGLASELYDKELPVVTFFIMNTLAVMAFSMAKFAIDWYLDSQRLDRLQKQNVESELKGLKAQIQPHFLFNSLNTIYGLVRKKDQETAEVVLKLSDILRYVLYESTEERVPLERELAYLKNYIDFIKLRTRRDSDITFEVNGDGSGYSIAPLLLIPFIENCFKHGMDMHITEPWVKIKIEINQDTLDFTCANSNYNRRKEKIPTDSGIGLCNAKRRLELLYPKKHVLTIKDDLLKLQFVVNLKIQLV